eukprot:TRINITY_DN13210_c0_g1_i1.p1 TRINITY_DN13210_c0_g1~~TRINITY_DN13210_c0_g1_i1.p1  ORF type:complete len:182 (-),score=22.92 TRINITY_DN13210_c0_g1_i1:29-574(-)
MGSEDGRKRLCLIQSSSSSVFIARSLHEHIFHASTAVSNTEMQLGLELICGCALVHSQTRSYALLKELVVVCLRQLEVPSLQSSAIDAMSAILLDASQETLHSFFELGALQRLVRFIQEKKNDEHARIATVQFFISIAQDGIGPEMEDAIGDVLARRLRKLPYKKESILKWIKEVSSSTAK